MSDIKTCPLCNDIGMVEDSNGTAKDGLMVVCPICGGSGKVAESATSRRRHIYKYCGDQYLE